MNPMSVASRRLVIATRESRLAMWQAEHVRDLLSTRLGADVSLLGMTTRGDQILDRALSKVGGKGLFVKELEAALAERRADLAVHSLKDVPMDLPEGFVLAAILEREDPRDAFVSPRHGSLEALPPAACVGTSSLRRLVQLRARRPDLRIEPLRGNLDTRLRKLDEGRYDAIVLAAAGLVRLGLARRVASVFTPQQMLPAAGQGALAIECRSDDDELRAALAAFTHAPTWLATHAERAVSRRLGGSCSMPLAAHARWQGGELHLDALLGHAGDPSRGLLGAHRVASFGTHVRAEGDATARADALGVAVADELLARPDASSYIEAHA
jgi:hydroxymethylbilane synthase